MIRSCFDWIAVEITAWIGGQNSQSDYQESTPFQAFIVSKTF